MGDASQAGARGSDRYRPGTPTVEVRNTAAGLQLDAGQAKNFAGLLDALADGWTPEELHALADEVREAATVIDPARQLAETMAKMSAAHKAANHPDPKPG